MMKNTKHQHRHGAKNATKRLEEFILMNVIGWKSSFIISDVKRDGMVFVRFRSSPFTSAFEMVDQFRRLLCSNKVEYVFAPGDVVIRVKISQCSALQ